MLEKLQEIVRRYTEDENIILTGDMVLLTDLGLNSFELVQMVCEVEDAFGIDIPDRVISGFKTVGDVVAFITNNSF